MKSERYNGYANYETWAVSLWLDNDEGTYYEAREIVAGFESEYRAGDALQEWVTEMAPIDDASMFTDLLSHALGRVAWSDIARGMHEEVDA